MPHRSAFDRPVGLVLLAITLLCAQSLVAQSPTTALHVNVRTASSDQPIAGAQVVVHGAGIGGSTNSSGELRLNHVMPGARLLEVRYLGYSTRRAMVVLEEGRTSEFTFDLDVEPIQLAEVRVRAVESPLKRRGFHERRGNGMGTFISRDQISAMRPRYLSDVLRRVSGVNLTSTSQFGGNSRASMRGTKVLGPCPIQYYIDGTLTSMVNVDEIQPGDVEGLEIYRGAASIPPAYNKGTAMCGVVVIWTRIQ